MQNNLLNNINILLSNEDYIKHISNNLENFNFITTLEENFDYFKQFSISLKLALDEKLKFYRGTSIRSDNSIILLSPKKRKTVRETKGDYLRLLDIMRNSKYFKNSPDRQKSLIFTNNYNNASNFGTTIVNVLPINGAAISLTPEDFNYNLLRKIDISLDLNISSISIGIYDILREKLNNDKFIELIIEKIKKLKQINEKDIFDTISNFDYERKVINTWSFYEKQLNNIYATKFKYYSEFYVINHIIKDFSDYLNSDNLFSYIEKIKHNYNKSFNYFFDLFCNYKNLSIIEAIHKSFEELAHYCIKTVIVDNKLIPNLKSIFDPEFRRIRTKEYWTEDDCLLIHDNIFREYFVNKNKKVEEIIRSL